MDCMTPDFEFSQELLGVNTHEVLDYWHLKKKGMLAPTWKHFELMDVHSSVPIILVLDAEQQDDQVRYKYRFVGTKIVRNRWKLDKPDHTGLYFEDVQHQYDVDEMKRAYDECYNSKRPVLMKRHFDALDASGEHERLVLPLITEDGEVDKLVCVLERLKETKKW